MLQFIVGIMIGVFITLLCIAVWAVFEDEKNDLYRDRHHHHDRH